MTPNADSRRRYHFDLDVVLDDDGNIYGAEMTCATCGEIGYKGPDGLWEHALTHLSPNDGSGA